MSVIQISPLFRSMNYDLHHQNHCVFSVQLNVSRTESFANLALDNPGAVRLCRMVFKLDQPMYCELNVGRVKV